MFKGFASGKRPKQDDDEDWSNLFPDPDTEAYLRNNVTSVARSISQRVKSRTQASDTLDDSNNTLRNNDHSADSQPLSPIVPPNTATHNDGTHVSIFGNRDCTTAPTATRVHTWAPDRTHEVDDVTSSLVALKMSSTTVPVHTTDRTAIDLQSPSLGGYSGGFSRPLNHQTSFGFGENRATVKASDSAVSFVDSGTVAGRTFSSSSTVSQQSSVSEHCDRTPTSTVPPAVQQSSGPPVPPLNDYSGFGVFKAVTMRPATIPPPVFAPRPLPPDERENGFGFGERMPPPTRTTAPSFGSASGAGAYSVSNNREGGGGPFSKERAGSFDGFRGGSGEDEYCGPYAKRETTEEAGWSGFDTFSRITAVAPAPALNDYSGFGVYKGSMDRPSQPKEDGGFSGFGTVKSAVPSHPQRTVTSSVPLNDYSGFGTVKATNNSHSQAQDTVAAVKEAPSSAPRFVGRAVNMSEVATFGVYQGTMDRPSQPKDTVAKEEDRGFSGFGTVRSTVPSQPQRPLTDFSGFGTVKSTVPSQPQRPLNDFSGFGTVKSTVPSQPQHTATSVPLNDYSGFGTFKGTVSSSRPVTTPANDFPCFGTTSKSTVSSSAAVVSQSHNETAQMNFGTLNVSGPKETLNALKEKEKAEDEKKSETGAGKKMVRFEDVKELKDALARGESPVVAASSVSATDTEDDADASKRPTPWGSRPCFRKMLAGGNKKLNLEDPPRQVSLYFDEQVYRSYGCTYDDVSNTFYATSPGQRGLGRGKVVALDGSCKLPPICVTNELDEPAAIAVYEAGLSVCTVTNRGIFVFTRKTNEQGELVYLSRQVSVRGGHRGIAATERGGIVSFNNGRIRMFDGSVAHRQEKVLCEAEYDRTINDALFPDNRDRRMERSNCCFMDIVRNRLVMSDLQKHVISLWEIAEGQMGCEIRFVRAVDVAVQATQRGKVNIRGSQIPGGKCAYAAGIRLDAEGWVMCADAEGRTIQIFDDSLNFVTRVVSPSQLPYISGLYIESQGHLIVCDRKSQMGGLRVYMLEPVADDAKGQSQDNKSFGFAAAAKQLQSGSGGGRF